MKLIWNEESKTISIGDFKVNSFVKLNLKEFTRRVLMDNNHRTSFRSMKTVYKDFTNNVGCTPSVLYKIFNKLQYKHFVVPYMDYAGKLAFNKRGVDPVMLNKIVKNKDTLDQVKSDGLMNLIPFVCQHNKNPQELKGMFGKHWKKIANNTLHKNKYLSKFGKNAGEYAEVPTTLLKQSRLSGASVDLMKHLTLHYKGQWNCVSKNTETLQVVHLFRDTERMAGHLGKVVNPVWTPRRLKEEHDKFAKDINAKRYSKDEFVSVKDIKHKEVKHQDICATLLNNAFDIAEEGTAMNHCVGMYGYSVARGTYLVYSIRDNDGNRLSTLGINIYKDNNPLIRFIFNQHYGKCNSVVTCEKQKYLADYLIELLNKK